ncbi:ISL3 family transposase [Streptacidiphilus monticola]|uniref:ISL3 family transposase n=1 Tax=Streptacidiphilus monticola TaxID=2161674 RepID=A0ABW1G947_9ACTN
MGRTVRIAARCSEPNAPCPVCGTMSERVHSRYVRRLADTAVGAQVTAIDLLVRRFVCGNTNCAKRTFAEQVDRLTFRYGRRTVTLQRLLERLALDLGGQAGSRMAEHLAVPISASTLLRQIHRLEVPGVPAVEVLGVDEFAFRRGRTFGTILIDMHTRRPVDVLPDHTSDTFAAWLREHPHVKLICRDRGGSFADGAQRALPGVPQVADRWHLLDNLATAVERAVRRHRGCLRPLQPPVPDSEPAPETSAQQRVRDRWAEIRALRERGLQIQTISARLGLDRKTVRRYYHAAQVDSLLQIRIGGSSVLDPYKTYLTARWEEGCGNAEILREEIHARGYRGGRKTVRRFLNSLAERRGPVPGPQPPLKVGDVVRWIVGRPENQSETARQSLKDLCDRCEHTQQVSRLARDFTAMLRRREGHQLTDWLTRADDSQIKELQTFANGLRKDLAAVTAGLTLHWNSGPVEGNVTRIKLLKRQSYGRAGFALLRRRILLAN